MAQSNRGKLICDKTIEYSIKTYGEMRTVCPAGYAGLSEEVLEMAGCSLKRVEDFSKYVWGIDHRRANSRLIKALRTDSRFEEFRVRAHHHLVAFRYVGG